VTGVVVDDYDETWPQRAADTIAQIRTALGPDVLRIDHIGSTSIPGMAAKNLLDLQAIVDDLGRIEVPFGDRLAPLEFVPRPYFRDHVPAGLADDPARWAKRFWCRRVPGLDRVNLHVRVAGSPNARLAVLFRDWFRAHPLAVPAYSAFKRDLASDIAELDDYTMIKDRVVDLVIVAAEEWADATGWRDQ
jgi:dephospho-CoA kinase